MNKEHRGMLIGMILGDGNLYIFKKNMVSKNGTPYVGNNSKFTIKHSIKQIEYLKHKACLIHKIFGGNIPTIGKHTQFLKKTGKNYGICQITKGHKYFRLLHRWLYCNNGKKTYTRKVLDMLNPHGIALWYMDDGSLKLLRKKDGNVTSVSTTISTYCTKEEAEIIQNYFKETWDIDFKPAYHSAMKSYYMRANTANSKKFFELIKNYMIPSMYYKLNFVEHEPLAA